MKKLPLILHEAKLEIRSGFSSGIVTLAFWGLVLYLLLSIVNADYMQKMGATDIPRNSASIIYLMATGCMFFQFFTWAWVFSQPILRDKNADLHELVLTTPNSLNALLWGRFLGAAVIGAILSASALVGFVVSPILVWTGMLPASAIGDMPWQSLGFALLWLQIPASIGIGAIYFIATIRTRSLAGPFGLAAALMMLWMFAIIVLQGGDINPILAAIMDPSLFTFAYAETGTWTPQQKATAFLPITSGSVLNRAVWCLLPLLTLAVYLRYLKREKLVLGSAKTPKNLNENAKATPVSQQDLPSQLPAPASTSRALNQVWLEAYWRLKQVVISRAWWLGVAILLTMGVASSFTQIIWHAEGPMSPRLEMLLPLLKDAVFLVMAFVLAALAGLIYRRDHIEGFNDMLSATPAPSYVQAFAITISVAVITLLLALIPGISGIVVVLLTAPSGLEVTQALSYQALIVLPPLLELSMMVLLVHALFRHAGVAYSMSMFVTFILVLNHELELVHYPPYEMGITAHIKLSALTGWSAWLDYLIALDTFKLSLAITMAGIASILIPRGLDSRLAKGAQQLRTRLLGPQGAVVILALITLFISGNKLEQKLVVEGDYASTEQEKHEDALREAMWRDTAGKFAVQGGTVELHIMPKQRAVMGKWQLQQATTETGVLHFELPEGFVLNSATVAGQEVNAEVKYGHMTLPMSKCTNACDIELNWQIIRTGWSAEGEPTGFSDQGVWLTAERLLPKFGVDPSRMLRAPTDRSEYGLTKGFSLPAANITSSVVGVAPAANWQWQVSIEAEDPTVVQQVGNTELALDFAVFWFKNNQASHDNNITVHHSPLLQSTVPSIQIDVAEMQQCVNQRLNSNVALTDVVQWPRGLGETKVSDHTLLLAEAPNWDIAERGAGRWLRRVEIAKAMAQHHILSQTQLNHSYGAPWLKDGVAGAIGLICMTEFDGIEALHRVLTRYSDRTTRDLSSANVPIVDLATAPIDGWPKYYAPMAALDWTQRQTPSSINALLKDIKHSDIHHALTNRLGQHRVEEMLGVPLSSSLQVASVNGQLRLNGERWQWIKGGWQLAPLPTTYRLLSNLKNKGNWTELVNGKALISPPAQKVLALDAWPSFQRDPKQNLLGQ